ncbi:MAG: TIGR03088 family PEP-CTERM/XrtA system glycosyltransferase [Gammaproteobacteria bacterium]
MLWKTKDMSSRQAPLIVHIIYRLGVGGLENGLVNIINRMPADRYRHAIICLTDSTDFSQRLSRDEVAIYQMHKRAGQDWALFFRIYRLLKQLQPAIVHTRNLAAIEYQICAFLAGVPYRLHGEHGWDVFDPDGSNAKYQWLRRLMSFFIHRFVPLSKQIQEYLQHKVGIPSVKIVRICNGVDTSIFYPRFGKRIIPTDCPIKLDDKVVIGTVGRMHGVKDQLTLVNAYIHACGASCEFSRKTCLVLIGDGPLREEAALRLNAVGLAEQCWLPGERNDIAELLRSFDLFVLPSRAEGISNTILEAMATGLPVIATRVGGNPELVIDDETGCLVEKEQVAELAEAMLRLTNDVDLRQRFSAAACRRVKESFSIDSMVTRYRQVYDGQ